MITLSSTDCRFDYQTTRLGETLLAYLQDPLEVDHTFEATKYIINKHKLLTSLCEQP